MNESKIIPLFPLQTVLLPEFPLPLHIFEEKYKFMIDNCIAEESEFGVVFTKNNKIKNAGCTAKIIQVYNTYEDGKMDLLTIGHQRFKIKNLSEENLYLNAEVEYFDDEVEFDSSDMYKLSQRGIEILQNLGKLKISNEMLQYIGQLNLKVLSFIISSIGGYSNIEKQNFLEMTSTSERLERAVGILEEYYQKVNAPSVN